MDLSQLFPYGPPPKLDELSPPRLTLYGTTTIKRGLNCSPKVGTIQYYTGQHVLPVVAGGENRR